MGDFELSPIKRPLTRPPDQRFSLFGWEGGLSERVPSYFTYAEHPQIARRIFHSKGNPRITHTTRRYASRGSAVHGS